MLAVILAALSSGLRLGVARDCRRGPDRERRPQLPNVPAACALVPVTLCAII